MAEVVIRHVANREFDQVLELLAENGLPEDGLDEHVATTLVAEHDGQVIGSAALEVYGTEALLRSVAVDADWRNQRLGERLTTAALDLARGQGVMRVYLLTDTAENYFPRFGFRTVERKTVDAAVRESVEFTTVCPESATVMAVVLWQGDQVTG